MRQWMRWGLGPVFIYECLVNSRRWQTYALRSAGVAALLSAMALTAAAASQEMAATRSSWRNYADLGAAYFAALIGVELAVVMLAAPAAAAGAICVDRARGTLAHMLMTDLSDAEIVLGKLAARLLPVFGLVACTWPVMAISSLLGGIDPIALTLAFAIIVAVAILGCTMAIAVSVWAKKSHEVVLATYTVFILALLLWPIWYLLAMTGIVGPAPPWALLANPFYLAFAPYADPGKLEVADYLWFFGGTLGPSALLTVLAVWRTRPVACRDSVQKSRGARVGFLGRVARWLPGPSLDRNPVLWREWHRTRPSLWMTAILALLMGTTGALCTFGAVAFWRHGADFRPGASYWEIAGVCSYVLHVIFGLLLLAAIAPTSMAEERQRGSLDILAVTALSTRAIVIGKWLGTFRLALLMAICPGLLVLAMATARSDAALNILPSMPPDRYWLIPLGARLYGVFVVVATIVAHGALLTSIGLALAVWLKRQSRAIGTSVGSFILVAAAWPIAVSITVGGPGDFGSDLASLSPVVICSRFISFYSMPIYEFTGDTLWCGAFWAVEVFAVALALLGLTVRTFDRCFDRIPDRPEQFSVWTLVVATLAGMISAGFLVTAITTWIEGVSPAASLAWQSSLGILASILLTAIGLVLVAVEAAKTAGRRWSTISRLESFPGARSFVLARWSESLRLVLLLAIGPALFALALATAKEPQHYEPQYTKNAAGAQVISSWVLVKAHVPDIGQIRLGKRLIIAVVFILTTLVHGGAAISVGLGFAALNASSRRARLRAVGLAVLVVSLLPLYVYLYAYTNVLVTGAWSFVVASTSLLAMLRSRLSLNVGETLWPVIFWDAVVAVCAAALSWWASWAWELRSGGVSKAKPLLATDFDGGAPAPETALARE